MTVRIRIIDEDKHLWDWISEKDAEHFDKEHDNAFATYNGGSLHFWDTTPICEEIEKIIHKKVIETPDIANEFEYGTYELDEDE